MKQVLCTLPNASDKISGVKFEKHERGMISEPLEDQVAGEKFANVPGYEFLDWNPSAKYQPHEQTGEAIVVKTESVVKGVAPIAEEIAPIEESSPVIDAIAPIEESSPVVDAIAPAEETSAKKSKTAK